MEPSTPSKNPPTPQNLTPDFRPLPLRIPHSSVKVSSLVVYFDRKIHEEATPVTSAPHHHPDWKAIPSDKVRSLVLKFSSAGIATPVSNSRIGTVSPVTVGGRHSRAGEVAVVDNGGVVSGSKGEGAGWAPVRSASRRVGKVPSYATSSSWSLGDTDGSTTEDLRVSNYRKLDKLRTVKGWKVGKNSKHGGGGRESGSIDGQSTVARKSMRRKKASIKSLECKAIDRPIKDICIREGPPRKPEQLDDGLLRGLERLAQRESLRSPPLEPDPTNTDPPASLSVLAAVQDEADAEIKSHEIVNAVSNPASRCPFLGAVSRTFRSVRDYFKKAPPQQTPPATTTATGGTSDLVGRTSEKAGCASGLTINKATSSATSGGGTASTSAKYLSVRKSPLQSQRPSSTGSSASEVRYETKELKPETLHLESEGGNSCREGLTGTALDEVSDVKSVAYTKREALDAAVGGSNDDDISRDSLSSEGRGRGAAGAGRERSGPLALPRGGAVETLPAFCAVLSTPGNVAESSESMTPQESPQVPARPPSPTREMAFPSPTVRGKFPSEGPTRKSTPKGRKPNPGEEIVREVPKRKVLRDGQWIIDQTVPDKGTVANRDIKKIQDKLGNHSYHDPTSSPKSDLPWLAPKANSTGTNSYSILPLPQLPLGSGDKRVVDIEEGNQYQDYIVEPGQARLPPPPLNRCAVGSGFQGADRLSGVYHPPPQE